MVVVIIAGISIEERCFMSKKKLINVLINDFKLNMEEIEGMTISELKDLLEELYDTTNGN